MAEPTADTPTPRARPVEDGDTDPNRPAPRIGCFPGSFDPPTVAHLAIAEAALHQAELDRVDLIVSRWALGKEHLDQPSVRRRIAVLERVAASRPWLGVAITDERLIAEVAAGYDAVVLGADKWRQVVDPAWYGDDPTSPAAIAARDAAVAALPRVLVAPRAGDHPEGVEVLVVDEAHRHVSSSAVRAGVDGAHRWVLPEAGDQAGGVDPDAPTDPETGPTAPSG